MSHFQYTRSNGNGHEKNFEKDIRTAGMEIESNLYHDFVDHASFFGFDTSYTKSHWLADR